MSVVHSAKKMTKRERRRRQMEEKGESEDNEDIIVKQNNIATKNQKTTTKNSRIFVRRDTFTVTKSRTEFDYSFTDDKVGGGEIKDGNHVDEDDSYVSTHVITKSDSESSKNLTHTINVETWKSESKHLTHNVSDEESLCKTDTYSVKMKESDGVVRPIPAPRRRPSTVSKEPDKNSSDTDKDVMDIDADEVNVSRNTVPVKKESTPTQISIFDSDIATEVPKPKPRKLSSLSAAQQSLPKTDSISKSKSLEEITVKVVSPRSTKSNPETKYDEFSQSGTHQDSNVEVSSTLPNPPKKSKFTALLQRGKRKKTSKMYSSVIKLNRARIPTISSILKDFKDDTSKTKLEEEQEEEDKMDFQIDSPHLPQSAPNDKMYVQYKNGFYLKSREDIFKHDGELLTDGNDRMEDAMTSTMSKTAMLFQKYWSRSMIYFHGLLAGLGFCHAFAVTAILIYLNYETKGFIAVYSYLALKIHFIFYTLSALCIISCLDRLDIGNLKKKHWECICSKYPSLWLILITYIASFSLTFINYGAESRFDGHQYENVTGERLWDEEVYGEVPKIFSCWYHIIWARDAMVLIAWLLISMTKYPDNLYIYVKELGRKVETNKAGGEGELSFLKIDK